MDPNQSVMGYNAEKFKIKRKINQQAQNNTLNPLPSNSYSEWTKSDNVSEVGLLTDPTHAKAKEIQQPPNDHQYYSNSHAGYNTKLETDTAIEKTQAYVAANVAATPDHVPPHIYPTSRLDSDRDSLLIAPRERRRLLPWITSPFFRDPTFNILLYFLLGLIISFGHHFFNHSRHHKAVDNSMFIGSSHFRNQALISFVGTLFAFAVKSCYTGCVLRAYEQIFWKTLVKTSKSVPAATNSHITASLHGGLAGYNQESQSQGFSLRGVDALATLPTALVSWSEKEVWRSVKKGNMMFLVAALVWIASLGTVFAPGTISVVARESTISQLQHVPILDFLVANKGQGGYGRTGFVDDEGGNYTPQGSYLAPAHAFEKLARQTAESGLVIPGNGSPCDSLNCTYTISFVGPAQQCEDTLDYSKDKTCPWKSPTDIDANDTRPVNPVYDNTGSGLITYYLAQIPANLTGQVQSRDLWVTYAYLPEEFWPDTYWQFENYTHTKFRPYLGKFDTPAIESYQDFGWKLNVIRCRDYNATYTVNVGYVNGIGTFYNTTLSNLMPTTYYNGSVGQETQTEEDYYGEHQDGLLYRAHKDILISLLEGEIRVSGRVTARQYWGNSKIIDIPNLVDEFHFPGTQGFKVAGNSAYKIVYLPKESLRQKIEELSMNITLSMLGYEDLVYRDTTGASGVEMTLVEQRFFRNVYQYNPRNLLIGYGALTLATALVAAMGVWAVRRNGFVATVLPSNFAFATAGIPREKIENLTKEEFMDMKMYVDKERGVDPVFKRNDGYV